MRKLPLIILGLFFATVALVPGLSAAQSPHFPIHAFSIDGEIPLSASQVDRVLSLFTGDKKSLSDLQSSANALEEAIKAHGYVFYRVIVPPQKLETGTVTLKVLHFTIGDITVTGNEHFDAANIKNSFPLLQSGTSPDSVALQKTLQVANRHPAKRTTILMRQSNKLPDTIDAELKVQDVDPEQVFMSFSNTGTPATGNERLSFGYQHSNLFNRDHSVTLSYTTSPGHWDEVKQMGGFYRIPFYKIGGSLTFSAIDSDVDSGMVGNFDVSGAGRFYGARYQHELRKQGTYNHSIYTSIEDKAFKNDVVLLGTQLGVNVRSRPLTLGYKGQWKSGKTDINLSASYSANIGSGAWNEDSVYSASRLGADAGWEVLRYSIDGSYRFDSNWQFRSSLRGQDTRHALISGEQIGLGGANSIRGFEEREISGDHGWEIRNELWGPPLDNNLRLFGFVDSGFVKYTEQTGNTSLQETITSTGIGGEFQWNRLTGNFSWGYVLDDVRDQPDGDHKLHISLVYRF